jgi:phospholipase C
VFLILMENHDWSSIKGSASAPYLNHTLLPMASHAEQYYNPPNLHPSLPNYLWLEAGTNFGVLDDGDPSSNHQSTSRHLVDLLEAAGLSWRAYQEGISGTDCPLTDVGSYTAHHDPFVYFDDVTQGNNPGAMRCITHVRPYAELAADLANDTVADYNFITPDDCDNMHDDCTPLNDRVRQGDAWLSTEVPKILASRAYADNGAIFITWDEGKPDDGPIGLIVLSPKAKGRGYQNTIHYTHSSTLRTIEEIFGVTPMLGDAANAADLRDLFVSFP